MDKKQYRPRLSEWEVSILDHIRNHPEANKSETVYVDRTYNEGELWFVLPDAHYPFHDEKLMQRVFKCIDDNKPSGIVINGDWLDLFCLGSYNADSLGLLRNISLTDEYESGLDGIKCLNDAAPTAKKVFIYGNHEDRYFRTLNSRDNAKYGEELQRPEKALKLEKYGFKVYTNWKDDYYTVGDLDVMHGFYTNIHTAAKHLSAHGRSVMFGHTHRVQTYFTSHEAAFNVGCLADIRHKAFGYMPRMQRENWSQGFASITVHGGKSYVTMITVRNGRFLFNGKFY